MRGGGLGDAASAPVMSSLEPLIGPREVATFLNVDVKTVRRMVLDGDLPTARIGRKRLMRFKRQHVEQLVKFETLPKKPAKP